MDEEQLTSSPGEAAIMPETPAVPVPGESAPATPVETPETAVDPIQEQINAIISEFIPDGEPNKENELKLLQMLKNVHDKLLVAVENDPAFGSALDEMFKGGNPKVALARAYGPDAFQAVEGEPDEEEMGKAFGEAQGRIANKKETATTIAKNQEMSIAEIQSYMEEKGYGEDEVQARLKKMDEIRQDFLNDKITKNHLQLIDKAMDYDQDVANAEEAGKVAGLNQNIVEKREKVKTMGDGLPNLAAQNKKPAQPKSYGQKFFEGVI
jgi:hypothetical protein